MAAHAVTNSSAIVAVESTPQMQFMLKTGINPYYGSFLPSLFADSFFTTVQDMDPEAFSLKLKEVQPLILYFDLDSTLFSVRLKETDEEDLSTSMKTLGSTLEHGLGDSDGEIELVDLFHGETPSEGMVRLYRVSEGSNFSNVALCTTLYLYPDNTYATSSTSADSVRFIARKRYLNLFTKIDAINAVALEKFQRPLIVVNILTNAGYDEHNIKALFAPAFPKCKTIYRGMFQNRYRDIDPVKNVYLSKGAQMAHNHTRFFEKIGTQMLDTCLLDDSLSNITDVENHGFRALHIPSNPYGRHREQSYAFGGGEHFFSTLEETVNSVATRHGFDVPTPMYLPLAVSHMVRLNNAPFLRVGQAPALTPTSDSDETPNYLDELVQVET
ncbi:MAG: hypothetical protein V4492_08490 [Chlamydiota bacterium]